MERIGIYGGSFNPPHTGHMQAADFARKALQLDRLLLIPAGIAPHKLPPKGSPAALQRLEMTRIATRHYPGFAVSDLEIRREGPSYTYLTIRQLRKEHPDAQLYFLMGTDMFLSFLNWKEPESIWKDAILGVFCRGEAGEKEKIQEQRARLEAMGARVELVENPVIPISSTQIRRMLVMRCADPFLPDGVGQYIREHGLYGTAECYCDLPMDRLEQVVISLLKPSRVTHVLGCRDTAVELARRWGADETDAARAGILHDITKALDGPLQLTLCGEYGMMLNDFSVHNPKTLHALTGSLVAERVFGENPAVVQAIRNHTTGAPGMSLLDKIIYVADYMEPNRDFPGVEELRRLAFTDIDAALKLGLEMTIRMLVEQGREVCAESRAALDWLNERK